MSVLNQITCHQITCPVCLTPLQDSARTCPNSACGFDLPDNYCQTCREAPPLPIAAIGYAGHGKTHLLAAIVLTLNDLANRRKDETITLQVLDEDTRQCLDRWLRSEKQTRTLPPTELRQEPASPMILHVSGLFPARTLLVYDVAGQSFHDMTRGHVCLPALRDIQTVWFVMSPRDVRRHPAEDDETRRDESPQDMSFLFSAYKTAMDKLEAKLEGRNAVIVLAKGDTIGEEAAKLRDYLANDPIQANLPNRDLHCLISGYEAELRQIAGPVEDFVCGLAGVRNLVNLLRQEDMGVSFCVTSALGKDPAPGLRPGEERTEAPWTRQRVLDPLIWTLLLEKQRVAVQTDIVLDPRGYPVCGARPVPELLWERLPRQQGARTWFLGRSTPVTSPGQPPPPIRRPRLIGSLLEPLVAAEAPAGRIVLITNNLVVDLDDFRGTEWEKRLLLVTTSDQRDVQSQWLQKQVIESAEDCNEVVEFITKAR